MLLSVLCVCVSACACVAVRVCVCVCVCAPIYLWGGRQETRHEQRHTCSASREDARQGGACPRSRPRSSCASRPPRRRGSPPPHAASKLGSASAPFAKSGGSCWRHRHPTHRGGVDDRASAAAVAPAATRQVGQRVATAWEQVVGMVGERRLRLPRKTDGRRGHDGSVHMTHSHTLKHTRGGAGAQSMHVAWRVRRTEPTYKL